MRDALRLRVVAGIDRIYLQAVLEPNLTESFSRHARCPTHACEITGASWRFANGGVANDQGSCPKMKLMGIAAGV